jgi:glycosyltransferase involved in cell wall biosynthesis
MLLLDLTHTGHTTACTGIQRQARAIFCSLARQTEAAAVCFDPFAVAWRPLDEHELLLARGTVLPAAGARRGTLWPLGRKLRSWYNRFSGTTPPLPPATGLVCPEIFSPRIAARLPELFAHVPGPRVAFFFDTIPLTHPELTPSGTVARFPSYIQELLQFDGIAANSRTTADSLLGYWRWLGVPTPPPVTVLPLGVDLPAKPVAAECGHTVQPQVLCVGTIEGRKNHLALLGAAEMLWAEGLRFELRLVGMPRPETAGAAIAEIRRLHAAGRPLRFDGVLDDAALAEAWHACAFSVYPSLIEGFGLPVIESLARGKPCICAGTGATGELVPGGGAIGVQPADAAGFAAAMRQLLTEPTELARLAAEARNRPVPTWDACAEHLRYWMAELPLRR